MQVPLHPMIVHFPMALTFVLPILVLVFAFLIKSNKMSPKCWPIIIGLQLAVVVSGYVALETGETEEQVVAKVLDKDLIHKHEEAAEIFVGSTVIALVMSISAYFVRKELGFLVKVGVAVVGLASCFLAYRTGALGGELVYKHGAASAYTSGEEANLQTPASEAIAPASENESLKPDENDYSDNDEATSEDDFKQED